MSYLVLDIETIPDLTVWSPPKDEAETAETETDIAPKPKRKSRKKPGADVFPPLYAHRPVAIGFLLLDDALAVQHIGCLGTSQFGEDEAGLLKAFDGWMLQMQPRVVTFRGRGFDLPVLALRAFTKGIEHTWYTSDHRHRYNDARHIDVFEALTESGAVSQTTGFSLDTFSQLVGLPSKGEANGASVKSLWERKEIAKIEGYCVCDVARTAFVFMRLMLMRGKILLDDYQRATKALFAKCVELNLGGITFAANTQKLFLEG